MNSTESLVAIVLGNVVLISLVAIIGGFLHHRRERLLKHAERMKALELGRELPEDRSAAQTKAVFNTFSSGSESAAESSESLPRKLISTAFWVAFWGFAFAAQGGFFNQGIAIAIAVAAGAIGVAAIVCGTVLASRAPVSSSAAAFKPKIEDDAFDVVSSRG